MKKINCITILTFVLSASVFLGCEKEKKDGVDLIRENPYVKNAIKEAGFPEYGGNNPPALAGTYLPNGKVTDASNLFSEMIGASLKSVFILSNQTTSGKIDFEERVEGIKVSGCGGYITGDNGAFTIYMESTQTGSEAGLPDDLSLKVVVQMSGKQSNTGNLTGVQGITIIIDAKSNNKAYNLSSIKGLWYKWEADFILQTGSNSSFRSLTNSDEQFLLQKAMHLIFQKQ